MKEEIYKTSCRGSHGGCGLLVKVKEGKIVSIEPDPDHPVNNGSLCNKVCDPKATLELVYHTDRLKYPIVRDGKRGSGRWKRISWDEAFEIIERKITNYRKQYGAESVVLAQGTGRDYAEYLYRFANSFGTPNVVTPGYLCYFPRVVASLSVCGGFPVCDYDNYPSCIIVWGCNPHITSPEEYKAPSFLRALQKADLILIDPRRTDLADKAKIHAQVRPGTDSALALGLIKVIIEKDLYDKGFIQKYSTDFELLRERVSKLDLRDIEKITWVKEKTIEEIAYLYATSKPAALHWGQATDGSINCFSSALAQLHLMALTGNLDRKGGNVIFPKPPVIPLSKFALHDRLSIEQRDKRLGARDFPMSDRGAIVPPPVFVDAVLEQKPYSLKALLIFGSNPLVTWPDSKRVKEALMKLDFMLVADLFMTPTAEIADIVLPAASWLEQNDVGSYWMRPGYVVARRKIVQIGDCKSDHEILNEIGKRINKEDFFESVEDGFENILSPSGLSWDEFLEVGILKGELKFEKYLEKGFSTQSRKYEFAPKVLSENGKDALPSYLKVPESPDGSPDLMKSYPLILTTGARSAWLFHSERRQLSAARKGSPEPMVEIHPDVAREKQINQGDLTRIETPRGSIKIKADVTDRVHPKVVSIPHGWWFPEISTTDHGYELCNANMLTSADPPFDPYVGAANLRALLCRVSKIYD